MSIGKSHPAVRFERVPVVPGRLFDLNKIRSDILTDVNQKTIQEFSQSEIELLLGEALYFEKIRIRKNSKLSPSNIFTFSRTKKDKKLWGSVQSGLLKKPTEVDRNVLLEQVVSHYSEEIISRFSPKVYDFATRAVPWGFNWLLNAASLKHFKPWGMTASLASCLKIQGEVEWLQRLSKKGTILLVPTHQSNIDSVLIGYLIYLMSLPPFAYGAGLNLFTNPILNFFMGNLGAYTVDREKTNALYKATLKNYSTSLLAEGVHSIFFPGGGRSRSGAIESHLKLGLLGTGMKAQIQNMLAGKPNPNVYVVPMVMSYHFVFEAASLIEDLLSKSGKHRFMAVDQGNPFPVVSTLKFFWKLFSQKSEVTVRVGKPLDIFGNFVDEEGQSIGPNGTSIDPKRWLTSCGELGFDEKRDAEYTRHLGTRLVDRFYKENTVLTSHLVAFSLFMALRKKYPELDLYRFLRLSRSQRSIPIDVFYQVAEEFHLRLKQKHERMELHLSEELLTMPLEKWVENGIGHLGHLHDLDVVKKGKRAIWTEDMNLLYYYRNRLTGYGLSLLGDLGARTKEPGEYDQKGFLA